MDPNITLARIRELVTQLTGLSDRDITYLLLCDITELVELVDALDAWMSAGGFPPTAWTRPPPEGGDTTPIPTRSASNS